MPRYYFDLRDRSRFVPVNEGMELDSLDRVQREAAGALADLARDAVRQDGGKHAHCMAIEVRDDLGPVVTAKIVFELDRRR